uniref:Uncharacterized protein n=1 Tax=Oreochromis niloticus TaxID=8128 RepID=A0A669B2W6_ORENI
MPSGPDASMFSQHGRTTGSGLCSNCSIFSIHSVCSGSKVLASLTRPPTQSIRPSTQSIRPPTQSIRPPTQSIHPPTQSDRPRTQSIRPPTRSIHLPTQSDRPPTQRIRPPTQRIRSPTRSTRRPTQSISPPTQSIHSPRFKRPVNPLCSTTTQHLLSIAGSGQGSWWSHRRSSKPVCTHGTAVGMAINTRWAGACAPNGSSN